MCALRKRFGVLLETAGIGVSLTVFCWFEQPVTHGRIMKYLKL